MSKPKRIQCAPTGKIAFVTQAAAHSALVRVIVRHRGRRSLQVYRCEWCALWHHGRKRDQQKAKGVFRGF